MLFLCSERDFFADSGEHLRGDAEERGEVLTGAGISRESGISTFRDSDGLWRKYSFMQLASVEGWQQYPEVVLDFYNARRRQLLEVEPNKAHILLAKLERWFDVTIITQNVDDLHERAGSSHVLHLHGELAKVCSSANKEERSCIVTRPLDNDIHIGDKANDGSQMRPYIVWFGEPVPNMPIAMKMVVDADFFIVVGTSLSVSPANILVNYTGASYNYVIDPNDVMVPDGFFHIKKPATDGMSMLYSLLKRFAGYE